VTSKRRPYKTYPKEFKLEALRMMETSDRPASRFNWWGNTKNGNKCDLNSST